MKEGLNPRQKRFVEEYLACGDAAEGDRDPQRYFTPFCAFSQGQEGRRFV